MVSALLKYPSLSCSVKPRNIYKLTLSTSETQKRLLIVFSVDAVTVHIGEQVRRQVNDIFSADNLPLHDHTERFPILPHTLHTEKTLTYLRLGVAIDTVFLPLFRLKSLRYEIVDCVIFEKCACISILQDGLHLNHECTVTSDLRSALSAYLF